MLPNVEMTGQRQSVPARHGIATFVPKGHTLKVINTYGTQTISTWVFALHKPPNPESEAEEKAEEEAFNQAQQEAEKEAIAHHQQQQQQQAAADIHPEDSASQVLAEIQEENVGIQEAKDEPQPEQATAGPESPTSPTAKPTVQTVDGKKVRSWTSYVPSVPSVAVLRYRNKTAAAQASKDAAKVGEEQVEGSSKDNAEAKLEEQKEDDTDGKKTDKVEGPAAESGDPTAQPDDEGRKVAGTVTPSETEDDYADAKSVQSSRSWGSYLPSIRRGKGASAKDSKLGTDDKQEKANQRTWSSYLPSGASFTSYLPSNSKDALSAFASSHHRDPAKSYAEQLYEFSKTPVGAASLSGKATSPILFLPLFRLLLLLFKPTPLTQTLPPPAATGSGTAGSLYAAYSAYTKLQASQRTTGPMEYLSLPHTISSLQKLSPSPGDTLLSNLHEPLLTLLDDTTPPAPPTTSSSPSSSSSIPLRHSTILPACDPTTYRHLAGPGAGGEEHGSCAENLVLALQEFNKVTGLKGARTVGADVTINSAPVPLGLFVNARVGGRAGPGTADQQRREEGGGRGEEGGQGGGGGGNDDVVVVEAPRRFDGGKWGRGGEKGGWVKFRAERDVVVVMSACPMDEGPMNGGRCMAANFVVEEPVGEEEDEDKDKDKVKDKGEGEGICKVAGEGQEKAKAKAKVQTSSEKINAKKVEAKKKGPVRDEPKKVAPAKKEEEVKEPSVAAAATPEVKGKRRDSAHAMTESAQPKVKKPPVIQRAKSAVEGRVNSPAPDRVRVNSPAPDRVKSPVPNRVKGPVGDRAKSPVSGMQSPRTGASTPSSDAVRNMPKPGKKKPKKLERRSSSMVPV
ncbi:uncharacterized protein BKCO1_5000036 [Diplodia corticola]|uniref:DUF1989 domain-containing protein n=1 Tax=Diplodia corticola TaxID=236234 RepID=A0A1J9QTF9_9PEZI|nr:uncharacterized protein BKCO1_5000036 [Diplodia corticola]OJD31274.1 hypothetical protein BKCO1_5000036 [Diplodia corticola]